MIVRIVLLVTLTAVLSPQYVLGQNFMDVLTTFVDLDGAVNATTTIFELAREAFAEEKRADTENFTFVPVDDAYPLAESEVQVLLDFHAACKTSESQALQTWCTGNATYLDESDKENSDNVLCPSGVVTHPCSGRVLKENRGLDEVIEFYWPWEGVKCNAYSEPTTVTHIYVPDEHLRCQLSDFDFSSMVSLQHLDLSKNELAGPFPAWLTDMPTLRFLNLSGNQLSGVIPLSFADSEAFEVVDLSSNKLSAPSLGFFSAFQMLRYLDISQNGFAAELSPGLFQSESLYAINVSHNRFHGPLPEILPPKYIVSIDVSFNELTGNLPPDLASFGREDPRDPDEESSLEVFIASHNSFSGSVPNISNLTSLQQFDVSHNQLNGTLLPTLFSGDLSTDSFLNNQFKCPIPNSLSPSNLLTCECNAGHPSPHSSGDDEVLVQGADGCSYCASGFFSNASTSHECQVCPAGTFSVSLASPEKSSNSTNEYCTPCAPGTFGNETKMAQCLKCPIGSVANGFGWTQCEKCFPGYFANGVGLSECSPCEAGSFSKEHGQELCEMCPPGSYTAIKGEAECLPCPIGSYQDTSGRTECLPCPEGFVAPFPGHTVCAACPPGSIFDRAAHTCRKCPPNQFSNASAQLQCLECPDGMAADGFGNFECSLKPKPGFGLSRIASGSAQNATTSAQTQVRCPPGSFNDGERLTCELCSQGTFTATSGSVKCSPCAKGSFSGCRGATSCEVVPIGTFTAQEGAWKPSRCPPNHFASKPGSSKCTECPWPSFSLVGGSSECAFAGPGEVYDFVVWPRLTMTLAGVSAQDFAAEAEAVAGNNNSTGKLRSSWTTSLAAYGITNLKLHLVTIEPQTPEDDLLFIEFAVETLPAASLPKRHKRNSTMFQALANKTAEFQQFVKSSRAVFNNAAETLTARLRQQANSLMRTNSSSNNSTVDRDESADESSELEKLVQRPGFLESLVRQLHRDGVVDVSSQLVTLSVLTQRPLKSSRAAKCPRGTYFATREVPGSGECRLCPLGTYSDVEGALQCTLCPKATFADEEGLEQCDECPVRSGAKEGSSECVQCYWFTYACEGFWGQVALVAALGGWYGVKMWLRCRRGARGDARTQQQNEQVALLAAVRSHGRLCASVQYEPMGEVSADTMWTARGF